MNNEVGITSIGFGTADYYFNLTDLAKSLGVDENKYLKGLGQVQMSVASPDEDIITLGYAAAKQAISHIPNKNAIKTLIFCTETSVDQSKSAGMYLHEFLELSPDCRVFELKQACYASTAALQMATKILRTEPDSSVLVVASDIANYGAGALGEPTQGCGSIAMILSAKPNIISIEPFSGIYSSNDDDFWRPNYSNQAFVDGKYSARLYLHHLLATFEKYQKSSNLKLNDIDCFCFHAPFSKMVLKAHRTILSKYCEQQIQEIQKTLAFTPFIGNCYNAALFLCLLSLLSDETASLSEKRVGFYAYGSGSIGEFFSGIIQPNYKNFITPEIYRKKISSREKLDFKTFREFYNFWNNYNGNDVEVPRFKEKGLRLKGVFNHKRVYEI